MKKGKIERQTLLPPSVLSGVTFGLFSEAMFSSPFLTPSPIINIAAAAAAAAADASRAHSHRPFSFWTRGQKWWVMTSNQVDMAAAAERRGNLKRPPRQRSILYPFLIPTLISSLVPWSALPIVALGRDGVAGAGEERRLARARDAEPRQLLERLRAAALSCNLATN